MIRISHIGVRTLLMVAFASILTEMSGQFTKPIVIDDKMGLTSNFVKDIAQDSFGFIWIGTDYGLNRFDGSEIMSFNHNPDDSNSLLNSNVSTISIDPERVIVGGVNGVSIIHQSDFRIDNYPFSCDSLIEGELPKGMLLPYVYSLEQFDRDLWIGTRACGLVRFNPDTRDFRTITFDRFASQYTGIVSPLEMNNILSMERDIRNDSILWIGTGAGLFRFNRFTENVSCFFQENEDKFIQDGTNVYRRLYMHPNGKIYYVTWSKPYVFDPETGSVSPLQIHRDDKHFFSKGIPWLFYHASDDAIWLQTHHQLLLYSLVDNRIRESHALPVESRGFVNLHSMHPDERIWMTSNDGAVYFDPLQEQIRILSYSELLPESMAGFARGIRYAPDGQSIFVLPQGAEGIIQYKPGSGTWHTIPIPAFIRTANGNLTGIDWNVLPDGRWVVSSAFDLFYFDPRSLEFSPLHLDKTFERELYLDLEVDSKGRIWIGTRAEGLIMHDPNTGKTTIYTDEIFGKGDSTRFPVRKLFLDKYENLWFSLQYGHGVRVARDGSFRIFMKQEDAEATAHDISNFTSMPTGTILATTSRGGIHIGSPDRLGAGLHMHFDLRGDSLFPSYCNGIAVDSAANMWILTDHDLIRIDPQFKRSVFSFNYTRFNHEFYAFEIFPDNTLGFGLRGGISILDPNKLQVNREAPIPYLTDIKVNDKRPPGNFAFSLPDLDLKHDENSLSVSFSSIAYTLPQQNAFLYKLEGFDPQWVPAGKRRFVNYTNLPSGNYAFRLRVANNEGLWNTSELSLPVSIATPWWETWWFRIGFVVILVSFIYAIYRYRLASVRKEARMKSDFERKLADVELSALRAQMNPHFIFNCLNSIENYIIRNEIFKAAEYINDFARLIRLILQNSRSEIIPLSDEIEALDLYLQMESLRFENQFSYTIDIDPSVDTGEIEIPPMLIQPFVENAIWHGLIPKKGAGDLRIRMTRTNGMLTTVIEDNGIGRKKSAELNASMRKHGKRSMGMHITKNRLEVINELHGTNATIRISDLKSPNGDSSGTRVELQIPIE